jgi:hypothetical protein
MTRQTTTLLFLLLTGAGCQSLTGTSAAPSPAPLPFGVDLSPLHPIPEPPEHVVRACNSVPQAIKDHVYVYFVNGFDPLCLGNLKGLSQYVKTLGFAHAYYGEMAQTKQFRQLIRDVRRADADARIVLVGYSTGANSVRNLANELRDDGIRVALLAYVGGDTIKNVAYSKPDNVGCVLNVNGHGLVFLGYDVLFKGSDIDGASNHRLDVRHMVLPSAPQTAELLAHHLVAISQSPPSGPPEITLTSGVTRATVRQ